MRNRIAAELMSGKLCVMLYLKTGDPEKDDPVLHLINKTVTASPFREIIPVIELDRNSVEENILFQCC